MSALRVVDKQALKSILWAVSIEAPFGAPRPKKLSLKIGLRYERACVRAIKNAVDLEAGVLHGSWIRYLRCNGENNICQPDILIIERGLVTVIECKNTWVENAWDQIELYREVCSKLYARKAVGLQMCKNVTARTRGKICRDLVSAINDALAGQTVTLHWSGKGVV